MARPRTGYDFNRAIFLFDVLPLFLELMQPSLFQTDPFSQELVEFCGHFGELLRSLGLNHGLHHDGLQELDFQEPGYL